MFQSNNFKSPQLLLCNKTYFNMSLKLGFGNKNCRSLQFSHIYIYIYFKEATHSSLKLTVNLRY